MSKSPLLRALENKHNPRSLQNIELDGNSLENYVIDLSDWMLQFSDNTRVIQLRTPTNTSPCQLANALELRIRDRVYPHLIVLLEGDGSALRQCLREEHGTPPIVVLSSEEQERIANASNPSDALRSAVVAQLPISLLTPYETSAFVQGNRFFGRKRELRSITQKPDKSHAVIGIRRIGKTSLMRELERRLRSKSEVTHYIDCSRFTFYDLTNAIATALYNRSVEDLRKQDTRTFFNALMKAIRVNSASPPILLLDEIDDLIVADTAWELFDMMRQMSQTGVCQFIFAGHRHLWKAHHEEKTPFYNWTQRVDLKPFTREDAEVLVNGPMKNMGVTIEEGVVERIYRETGGHPNLIQYYCKIMANQLEDAKEKRIFAAALDGVYGDADFRERLVSSFFHNTSPLEQALIYAIVLKQQRENREFHVSMSRADIMEALNDSAIQAKYRDVDDALELLLLAGVLLRTGGEIFRFNFPVLARMLSEQQPAYALGRIKAEGL